MKDSLSGGLADVGPEVEAGDRLIFFHDAVFSFHNQVVDVPFFSLIHGKIIFCVPFGDDQKVPVCNWISIRYQK